MMQSLNGLFPDPTSDFQSSSPGLKEARQHAAESADMLLWGASQAHSLAKLKMFSSMAKSVNDQQ